MPRQGVGVSSEFQIFETDEFQRKLKSFPARESQFIQRKLTEYVYTQLRMNPFFGPNIKKLKDYRPGTWRYRIGKFRVFFTVAQGERIVSILSVDARRDAYR
uniref:mRNA interferase RelE/StbE n=1 Tax=Candidatus Kentrum sp. DK TaxID=2126562 RepID=A0A450SCB8_9GAMM|nr:MAG: mRNA interferase RelE/StbE [Candidatus Kentron sp. DK]